jgi:hypothetical protein
MTVALRRGSGPPRLSTNCGFSTGYDILVYMAKRPDVDIRRKKSHSHKTAKRLAIKAAMLAAKKKRR